MTSFSYHNISRLMQTAICRFQLNARHRSRMILHSALQVKVFRLKKSTREETWKEMPLVRSCQICPHSPLQKCVRCLQKRPFKRIGYLFGCPSQFESSAPLRRQALAQRFPVRKKERGGTRQRTPLSAESPAVRSSGLVFLLPCFREAQAVVLLELILLYSVYPWKFWHTEWILILDEEMVFGISFLDSWNIPRLVCLNFQLGEFLLASVVDPCDMLPEGGGSLSKPLKNEVISHVVNLMQN